MKIQVLGAGCPKCQKLVGAAETAAQDLGLDYEIEKGTDIMRITSFGVMMTPALVVDGEVKVTGSAPSVAAIKELLG